MFIVFAHAHCLLSSLYSGVMFPLLYAVQLIGQVRWCQNYTLLCVSISVYIHEWCFCGECIIAAEGF